MSRSTGWFGIPGANGRESTQVHVVDGGKPICGRRLSKEQEYQWCADGAHLPYVECRRCLDILNRERIEEIGREIDRINGVRKTKATMDVLAALVHELSFRNRPRMARALRRAVHAR